MGDLHLSRIAGFCVDRPWGHKQRSSAWTAQSRGMAVTRGAVKELVLFGRNSRGCERKRVRMVLGFLAGGAARAE